MTYELGPQSLANITTVDPRLVAVAKLAITLSAQDFGFQVQQSRTIAEEAIEVHEGFSHTMHSHHLINDGSLTWEPTPSQVGCSGAVDAVPWVNGGWLWATVPPAHQWDYIYEVAWAFRQASIQLGIPVTWGGLWPKPLAEWPANSAADLKALHLKIGGLADGPHFELGRN